MPIKAGAEMAPLFLSLSLCSAIFHDFSFLGTGSFLTISGCIGWHLSNRFSMKTSVESFVGCVLAGPSNGRVQLQTKWPERSHGTAEDTWFTPEVCLRPAQVPPGQPSTDVFFYFYLTDGLFFHWSCFSETPNWVIDSEPRRHDIIGTRGFIAAVLKRSN